MKSVFKNSIVQLFIGVVLVVLTFTLNLQKIDLRYMISDNIPINITGITSTESVQQIEVKNLGNTKAEKIVIDIQGDIKSFNVIKYTQGDNYLSFLDKTSLEIIYPELPPLGEFKIIIKSEGKGIKKSDVLVKHNKGLGKDILYKRSFFVQNSMIIIFSLVYLSLITMGIRDIKIANWECEARYDNNIELLTRKTPFYISNTKWELIRNAALKHTIREDYFYQNSDIESSKIYKMMDSVSHNHFSDKEWEYIREEASSMLLVKMEYFINTAYSDEGILDILKIKKPRHLVERKWLNIQLKAYDRYLDFKKHMCLNFITTSTLIKEFDTIKPSMIPDEHWVKYIEFVKEQYVRVLFKEIVMDNNPMKLLAEHRKLGFIDILDKDVQAHLERNGYKQELLNMKNLPLVEEAKKIMEFEKPSWINDKDFDSIISNAKDLIELSELLKKNKEKEKQLLAEKKEIQMLKDKITKQLEIINEILMDYPAIERIEEYNNTFAPGNFKNLKKIALLNANYKD